MVRPRPRKRGRPRAELGDEAAVEEPAALLPLGAAVEVRSDESGFVGSFYEATVVGYQRSGLGYSVAYSTLSRSRDGGSPLRELAAAADVRPRPPPAPPREFAVHEMVEAFHNDGWWAGIVFAAPPVAPEPVAEGAERPRLVYKVCFPTSRELLEFEETALRPRRVFYGERWVPAAEAENGSPLFREGSEVEVSRSAKTFGKYWSPAIILKVIGATSFLVQYKDITEDGELASEILDSQYIRPTRNIIRMDSKYRFPPSSHVEVFHEGSWWPGVIFEVLDNGSTKKYVVKIKGQEADMDDVESVDLLTVNHTQLRPQCNWYRGKWERCLTEKSANNGPQLKPRKGPISAALASCSGSVALTVLAPCNDSEEIRDEPGFYLKKKKNDDDVLNQVCPDLVVCNENVETKHMPISYPEKVVKQQNTVISFDSHLALPSQSSVTGFCDLKYDPKLCPSRQLQLSSSPMITMPSAAHTGQLQASLFGAFGQLRPLPQGPFFGMQPHTTGFGKIVVPEKAFTDKEKQAYDKGPYLMTGCKQNINFESFSGTDLFRKRLFNDQGKQANNKGCYLMTGSGENINLISFSGTDLSRKRLKKSVPPQTTELRSPKVMQKRKMMSDKKAKGLSKLAATSVEPTEPNNDDGKHLSKNVDPGTVLLSEVNTVTCSDSRPLEDDKGSHGISVFLREGSVADEIIPSGVPIGADKFHQEDYIGATQHCTTKFSVQIENSVLSITSTLGNPGEAHIFPSESSTQCGSKSANADKSAIIMEQDTGEEFGQQSSFMDNHVNVHFLPSSESRKDTGDKYNMEATVKCVGSVVPTENVSSMGGMGKVDHQQNTCNLRETMHASGDGLCSAAFKKFAAHEQHGMSQEDHSSAMIEFAADDSQSIENSEITQLCSIGTSNFTIAEQGDTLIAPKDSEGTPMSKFVQSRTEGSCLSLLQRSPEVYQNIMDDRPTESLAIENLPFMKISPMWAQIEALEVFRKVPQQPNLHEFKQHVPELREGKALGLMLSFANLAESIKKLRIHDEDAIFKEKMEGLSLLEADGFDVRHLRSRLETLLHIKNGQAKLQGAIKDLEKKISHKEIDHSHWGTQIGVLTMTVRQLELQAHLFRCITQSAVSQKMNDASEIISLKTEVSELKRSYLSAEQRFSSAVAAPW